MLAAAQMKRIGLLGGSFNPAHRGHRRISLAAIEALGLDEVWWLVSPGNPLRQRRKDMAPFEDRLASARRDGAPARRSASATSSAAGTRYTVDTVRKAEQPLSQAPLHLADGRRHCGRISSVEALAQARGDRSRLR